jgi:cell wall-associated NlpC family hydrolase
LTDLVKTEIDERAAVVREARSWLRTPYHPQGDIKGAGVDCGMLLVRVFVDAGLCTPFDPRPYSPDWMLHRSEERYLGFIFDRTKEVVAPRPGDVMVFRFGRCYSHGGVVTLTSPLTIVHAYAKALMVIEEEIACNPVLCSPAKRAKFFSLWAKQKS